MESKNTKRDNTVLQMYANGLSKTDAANYISKVSGVKIRQAYYIAKDLFVAYHENNIDSVTDVEVVGEEEVVGEIVSELEFSSKYVYNKEEDTYLFLLEKAFGKNIVLAGDTVRSIIKNYSNYDGNPISLNQVSLRYSIPRPMLISVLRILGVTHDSLPVTNEELVEKDVDELKDDCIAGKRFALHQKIQKEEWKDTEVSAKKWHEFVAGKYNPFLSAIEDWNCPDIDIVETCIIPRDDKTFVIVLTDTHIGELTKTSWSGKSFNTKKAIENISSYLRQIEQKLLEKKYVPSKCKLVIMGDILNSFVDGMTRKGTKLHNDLVNGELFKVGLDVIISFVQTLRRFFPEVDISCIRGNHDSDLIYAVYYAAERFFDSDVDTTWDIAEYWVSSFKINNCLFLYAHGKDDVNHVALPKGSTKRFESFVQSLLLAKPEMLIGLESKYFISGHLHSYEHVEFNDFERIQVPSSVTADEYAEALGYMTKARQNCFVVGQNAIEETIHIYF